MKKQEAHYIPCNLCASRDCKTRFIKGGLEIGQCNQCGLVYANPRLTQQEIWKRYSPNYFWDEYMPAHQSPNGEFLADWHRQRAQPVLDLLKPYQKSGKLLEIGCAAGFFLKIAEENGWSTQGVEIMSPAVEYAQNTLQINVFEGTVDQAQFPAESFDAIIMIETTRKARIISSANTFFLPKISIIRRDMIIFQSFILIKRVNQEISK